MSAAALGVFALGACAERPAERTAQAASRPKSTKLAPTSSPATSGPTASEPRELQALASTAPGPNASRGIRRAQKSGSWYPEDRAWATAEIHRMFRLAGAAPAVATKPLALVVPHAGWRYSGVAAAAAFRNLHRGDFERVVLLGPAHGYGFSGFSLPAFDAYATPLGTIPVCPEARAIRDGELVRDLPEADHGEHSLELELPWLQETLGTFCIIPILVGSTNVDSERALARKLAQLRDNKTLFVVSSDFVHYGSRFDYTPFGPSVSAAQTRIFDLERQAIVALERVDAAGYRQLIAKSQATICGYRGQLVLLELLANGNPKPEAVTFAHYSSAELPDARDGTGSVGYVSLGFYPEKIPAPARPMGAPPVVAPCSTDSVIDDALGQQLIQLAKATLSTKLRGTNDLDQALSALPASTRLDCRQAVFVTLKAKGELRGCVGQVEPEYPLAEAIVRSAIDAATNDHRFQPVTPDELGGLTFELTVLSVPRAIPSYREIVLGKHGIILSAAGRRALFLPQVPGEQGWGLEDTLRALSNKAGLPNDAWKAKDASFSVFTGAVFEEHGQPPVRGRGKLSNHGVK